MKELEEHHKRETNSLKQEIKELTEKCKSQRKELVVLKHFTIEKFYD